MFGKKISAFLIAFMTSLILVNGCKNGEQEIDKEADIQAIQQIHKKAAIAIKNGDVTEIISIMGMRFFKT